jgi:hypothetical protein
MDLYHILHHKKKKVTANVPWCTQSLIVRGDVQVAPAGRNIPKEAWDHLCGAITDLRCTVRWHCCFPTTLPAAQPQIHVSSLVSSLWPRILALRCPTQGSAQTVSPHCLWCSFPLTGLGMGTQHHTGQGGSRKATPSNTAQTQAPGTSLSLCHLFSMLPVGPWKEPTIEDQPKLRRGQWRS